MQRKPVGAPLTYRGHEIQPVFMGPDLLCLVNGAEIPNFHLDAESARAAGKRYVDDVIEAKQRDTETTS